MTGPKAHSHAKGDAQPVSAKVEDGAWWSELCLGPESFSRGSFWFHFDCNF